MQFISLLIFKDSTDFQRLYCFSETQLLFKNTIAFQKHNSLTDAFFFRACNSSTLLSKTQFIAHYKCQCSQAQMYGLMFEKKHAIDPLTFRATFSNTIHCLILFQRRFSKVQFVSLLIFKNIINNLLFQNNAIY